MFKLHVYVDVIVPPSGNVIVMGSMAFRLLMTLAPSTRKCPVAPESASAICWANRVAAANAYCFFAGGGGGEVHCLEGCVVRDHRHVVVVVSVPVRHAK